MPSLKFKEDLLYGERAQDRVADVLRLAGAFCNKKDSRERFDFEAVYRMHTFRVEVKNEDNYATSGNIIVEIWQNKYQYDPVTDTKHLVGVKPSGLSWSEATVFVHTLGENVALYRSREMKQWIKEESKAGTIKQIRFGKADNGNIGYKLPVQDMDYPWFDYLPFNCLASSQIWAD